MRRIRAFISVVVFMVAARGVEAAPPADQQANYLLFQQGIVEAFNTYRAVNGNLPPLQSIEELARAAREQAETLLTTGSASYDVAFARVYELGYAGGPPVTFSIRGYASVAAFSAALVQSPGIAEDLADPTMKYVGVGVAAKAGVESGGVALYVILGGDATPAPPSIGTAGYETDSLRGLPALGALLGVYNGALTGDSTSGFEENPATGGLPSANAEALTSAISRLFGKPLQFTLRRGQKLDYTPPAALTRFAQVSIGGKLPGGIRWTGTKLTGKAKKSGEFRARMIVKLPFSLGSVDTVAIPVIVKVR